jgi:hypothetical protein
MFEPGIDEGITPETRRWRTLFHIIYIHHFDGVWVRIPGFDCKIAVLVPWEQIAPEIHSKLKVEDHYYGLAALGAPTHEGLCIYINEYPEYPKQYTDAESEDGLG